MHHSVDQTLITFSIKDSEEFFLVDSLVELLDMLNSVTDKDFTTHGLLKDSEEDTQNQKPYLKVIFGNSRVFQLLTNSTDGDEIHSELFKL